MYLIRYLIHDNFEMVDQFCCAGHMAPDLYEQKAALLFLTDQWSVVAGMFQTVFCL